MYLPEHFREDSAWILHSFIERHPLGTLIVSVDGRPEASHLPMLLDPGRGAGGMLAGHIARANPLWRVVGDGTEVLVVFSGADAYVSPSAYPGKAVDGRVVPTWNYAVVHARGRIRFFDDAARLRALVGALTDHHEAARPEPWAVSDAPDAYVGAMLKGIVGVEVEIASLTGRYKSSQNRAPADRAGVRSALEAGRDAQALDELVRDPRPPAR
jgi:transcriptional regulator